MTAPQILLVNLNEEDRRSTAVALQKVGFAVATAVTQTEAQQFMAQCMPDMLVLALECAEAQAAFAFCARIHAFSDLPIVLLFDRDDPQLATTALTDFAEDVVTCPLSARILVARIRRILARLGQVDKQALPIDWPRRRLLVEPATSSGQTVRLSSNDCRLLHILLRRQDEVVAQEYILRRLWPWLAADSSTVRAAVCRLRNKLKKVLGQDIIIAQRGGYRLQTTEFG